MAFTLPGRGTLRLMGEARQRKPAVGESHLFGIIAQDLISSLDYQAFVFGHGLATRFLDAILDDELVDLSHVGNRDGHRSASQVWTLVARAIGRIFDSLAISMCDQIPRENNGSRDHSPLRGRDQGPHFPCGHSHSVLRCSAQILRGIAPSRWSVRPVGRHGPLHPDQQPRA